MHPPPPLVSVIVPCFNYGRYLPDCLNSLRSQSWPHWECIVVDDGSSDQSGQVASQFAARDSRFRVISQANLGVSAARNAGILASVGQYVQFLDADDRIEPEKLQRQAAYLLANPDVDVVYGDVDYFRTDGGELATPVSRRLRFAGASGKGEDVLAALLRRNIMVVNAPMMRRLALDETGPFNEGLAGHEDWEYWIRLAMAGKTFHFLPAPHTRALVREHAASAVQDVAPMLLTNLAVRQQIARMPLTPQLARINRFGIGLQWAKLAKLTIKKGHPVQALRHGGTSLLRSGFDPRVAFFLLAPQEPLTRLMLWLERRSRRGDDSRTSLPGGRH